MKQMFFCNYIAFSIVTDADSLISGSSVFSKANLYILKFSIHIMLKPCLKDFEHYLASMWNECKCMVFGHSFFGLKWNWSFLDALCQIFLLGNLYAGQEATVRTGHGTPDWFQIAKGVAHQAPPSLGFSRQEHWSGLPFPPPRDFLDPGIKPVSPELAGTLHIS